MALAQEGLSLRPMKTTFSLLAACAATFLSAQTVLIHPDAIPAMGGHPVETRNYGVVPGLVTNGGGVLWDLSAQSHTVVGSTTDSILDPQATPYGADFPEANLAVRLVNQFGYYRVDSDSVLDLGMRLSAGSPSTVYADPARVLQFPAAVGDSWTDQVVNGATTSQWEITVLAEGTIQLSDVTIPDAVLVKRRIMNPGSTAESITWYRRSNALVPLGNVLVNGGVIVRVPMDISTGMAVTEVALFALATDPAGGRVVLSHTGGERLGEVRLIDASGRELQVFRDAGQQLEIGMGGMPGGGYLLRVAGERSLRTLRFVYTGR